MHPRQEQVVVVTGANSGIGLALARALHADGRRVAAIVRDWGRVDVLVINACLAVFAPFEERDLDTTRREFEVNFFGYLHLIAAVVPHMKR